MSECHNCKKALFRCQCIVDDNGKLQHPKDACKDACKEWVNQVHRWGRHGSLNSESANELTAFIQSQQEEIERLREAILKKFPAPDLEAHDGPCCSEQSDDG